MVTFEPLLDDPEPLDPLPLDPDPELPEPLAWLPPNRNAATTVRVSLIVVRRSAESALAWADPAIMPLIV
ncbi:MAG: hypothetical protein K2Q23_04340, partial [Bryobacteraceae bacterium]|nr:hypothetical protein [Bryobacteraceae bacterium]